jgi:hypothetical protein
LTISLIVSLSKNKRYTAIVGSLSCCGIVLYFIRALGRGRVREVTLLSDRKVRIKTSIPFISEELAAHQLFCKEPLALPKIEGNVVSVSSESVLTGPRLCLYQSGRRLPFELERSGHFPYPDMWDRLFFKKIKP